MKDTEWIINYLVKLYGAKPKTIEKWIDYTYKMGIKRGYEEAEEYWIDRMYQEMEKSFSHGYDQARKDIKD